MDKIRLPAGAKAIDPENGLAEVLVEIPGLGGWDVANKVAVENGMDLLTFAKAFDIGVYCDHIALDAKHFARKD